MFKIFSILSSVLMGGGTLLGGKYFFDKYPNIFHSIINIVKSTRGLEEAFEELDKSFSELKNEIEKDLNEKEIENGTKEKIKKHFLLRNIENLLSQLKQNKISSKEELEKKKSELERELEKDNNSFKIKKFLNSLDKLYSEMLNLMGRVNKEVDNIFPELEGIEIKKELEITKKFVTIQDKLRILDGSMNINGKPLETYPIRNRMWEEHEKIFKDLRVKSGLEEFSKMEEDDFKPEKIKLSEYFNWADETTELEKIIGNKAGG